MSDAVILRTRGISKSFGDFTAVAGVDYDLRAGEVAGIIGPNGAGKSTFFNLLTGLFPPTAGAITYHGADITKRGAHQRVALGLIRTFQLVSVFDSLPVLDNMILAVVQSHTASKGLLWRLLGNPHPPQVVETCRYALERVGIAPKLICPRPNFPTGINASSRLPWPWLLSPRCCCWMSPLPG